MPNVCKVDACSKAAHARGWCKTHYERNRKYGDPVYYPSLLRRDYEARFWARIDKDGSIPDIVECYVPVKGACWVWTGRPAAYGYCVVSVARHKVQAGHIYSYLLAGRVIPRGWEVDHLCRNRLCVNPDHLEAVTRTENYRRGLIFRVSPTVCPHGHEYTEENTTWQRGRRGITTKVCRTCRRERQRETARQKKESVLSRG